MLTIINKQIMENNKKESLKNNNNKSRFCCVEEPISNDRINTGCLMELTGSDPIYVRKLDDIKKN